MNELSERLERLGLAQYLEVFLSEGYDTWDTLCDITESDLNFLNVKLGHRRKLQRAIRDSRGQLGHSEVLSLDGSYRSEDSAAEGKSALIGDLTTASGGNQKRKYRRHPKPDENAPERAPSAYVIFSNHVRETLKGQELSFTEIAKVVGERWQLLPQLEKEGFERQAASEKERYYAQLAEYKKTPEYAQYQDYLVEFKAKHALPRRDGKRTKLETQESTSTRSSSHDMNERRRVSVAVPEPHPYGHQGSGSSPPSPAFPLAGAQPLSAHTTSPGTYSFSAVNSPQTAARYSPMSASPISSIVNRDTRESTSAASSDIRERERMGEYRPSSHNPSAPQTPVSHLYGAPPTHPLGPPNYQSTINLPSRRAYREPTDQPPPLVHEDTTLSTDSGGSGTQSYQQHSFFPPVDATKAQRMLPHPVPTVVTAPTPLEQRPALDLRPSGSSWPALLRASEIFRDADAQSTPNPNAEMDNPLPPPLPPGTAPG